MEKMKLKDLINIRTGKLDANASSENGKYPFFTCSKETLKINTYSYDCECVLLAGNGDLNVKYYNGKFDAYQRTYILECKNDIISTKYLYYFMKKYLKILRNQSIGGVIKYIKLANITEAIIPIYSKEEQEKIVNNISKVEEVLNIKNKQIKELNNLIKSQFVEMFRYNNFKKEKLKNNIIEMFIGPFGSGLKNEYFVDKENGYSVVYEQKHAINKNIKEFRWVDENKYKSLERFNVKPGDIIVSCRGTVGKTYIIPDDAPTGIMHPSIMKIRVKKEKYIPKFFEKILEEYLEDK